MRTKNDAKSLKDKSNAGFIAIMSAAIISILLLTITVSLGLSGFFGRLNILDSESKERSSALAEACINTAILNLAQGSTITGSVAVGGDNCNIISVQNNIPSTGQTTIQAQAVINKAYTNLKIIVDNNTFTAISWEECAVSSCL